MTAAVYFFEFSAWPSLFMRIVIGAWTQWVSSNTRSHPDGRLLCGTATSVRGFTPPTHPLVSFVSSNFQKEFCLELVSEYNLGNTLELSPFKYIFYIHLYYIYILCIYIFIFIFERCTRSSKMRFFFSCIKVLERINSNSQKYPRKQQWRRWENPTKYYTLNNIKSRNLIYDKGSTFINGGRL